jgi:hypothetical protein
LISICCGENSDGVWGGVGLGYFYLYSIAKALEELFCMARLRCWIQAMYFRDLKVLSRSIEFCEMV